MAAALYPTPQGAPVEELLLLAVPEAITSAQMLIGAAGTRWMLPPEVIREASQVLLELVVQAVADASGEQGSSLIGLRIRRLPRSIVVELWDEGVVPLKQAFYSSVLHRHRWGSRCHGDGQRVVWCIVPLAESADIATTL